MIKAAVMKEPFADISIEEFKYPDVEKGAVILKTKFSEICGTDVHLHHGRLDGVPYPIIPGHVSVGTVEETGGKLTDLNGNELKNGQMVTFYDVHEVCNSCWYCLVAKATTRCPSRKVYGITYSVTDGLCGGWSEMIYLKPGVRIVPLDDDILPEEFISGGCGLLTSFHAVERSGIQLGDTVTVQGTGPVGLLACSWAKLAGAKHIIAIGAPKKRLEAALSMGADEVIDINELSPEERIEKVREISSGRGTDVVLECSGNNLAVEEGVKMVRDNGTYLIVGQYTNTGDISINPHLDINKKHVNILGCWGFDFSHVYKSVSMLKKLKNHFPVKDLITAKYGLNDAYEGLKAVENLEVVKAVIAPNG